MVMDVADASRGTTGEPRRPYLPYVVFTEVIWGEQRVQGVRERYRRCGFSPLLFFGWGFCLALLRPRFARTPFFLSCAFTHSDTDWTDILTASGANRSQRGQRERQRAMRPGAGWGSSLCCWSGCHITPCGDDCAIYCLAGAGDLRQRSQTGSTWNDWARCVVCQQNTLHGD